MNKKGLRLKRWVSVGVYLSLVSLVFISMLFVSNILDNKYEGTYNLSYILKNFIKSDIPVTSIDDGKTTKPFTAENVNIEIDYYDKESSEESQKKSLILYENTYMPNTGILYSSSEPFEIIATFDGKVTKIKTEELLGNVIEITHTNNIVTTYYSVDKLNVKEGQTIKKGEVIATSGKNNISSTSDNMLLFEVSINGTNVNPNNYFEKELKDLYN